MFVGESLQFVFDPFKILGVENGLACCSEIVTHSATGMAVNETDKVYMEPTNIFEGDHQIQILTSVDGGTTIAPSTIDSIFVILRIVNCTETLQGLTNEDHIFDQSLGSSHLLSDASQWAKSSKPEYCPITSCKLFALKSDFSWSEYIGTSFVLDQ